MSGQVIVDPRAVTATRGASRSPPRSHQLAGTVVDVTHGTVTTTVKVELALGDTTIRRAIPVVLE